MPAAHGAVGAADFLTWRCAGVGRSFSTTACRSPAHRVQGVRASGRSADGARCFLPDECIERFVYARIITNAQLYSFENSEK